MAFTFAGKMTSKIEILPSSVELDDVDLLHFEREVELVEHLGEFERKEDIPCQPSGFRRRMVWASRGLVAYADYPEDRLSHMQIAFEPSATPGRPDVAADIEVHVNGEILSSETSESTLPKSGLTPVVEDRHMFYYSCELFRVDFRFERRRNKVGKKSGVPRLAYVSLSWRKLKEANQPPEIRPTSRPVSA